MVSIDVWQLLTNGFSFLTSSISVVVVEYYFSSQTICIGSVVVDSVLLMVATMCGCKQTHMVMQVSHLYVFFCLWLKIKIITGHYQ